MGQGKQWEGSTWISVQGPRVPRYATVCRPIHPPVTLYPCVCLSPVSYTYRNRCTGRAGFLAPKLPSTCRQCFKEPKIRVISSATLSQYMDLEVVVIGPEAEEYYIIYNMERYSVPIQSINVRLLRHDKMQANNSKQKGNAVSKKKACLENKPEN